MSEAYRNHDLFTLEQQLGDELQLMEKNLASLSDSEPGPSERLELQRRFSHIQNLFDRAAELLKSLDLDQTDPDLYRLLECKQSIALHYGVFRRLQNSLHRQASRDKSEREMDLSRERAFSEPPPQKSEPGSEDRVDTPPEENPDLAEDEAALIAATEEEKAQKIQKAQKRTANRRRQERFRQAGLETEHAAQAERAAQERARQEEAARLAMSTDRRAPVSEADLRAERYRQEDARQAELRAEEARRAHDHYVLSEHRRRQEASESFIQQDKRHLDFSTPGQYQSYGYEPTTSSPSSYEPSALYHFVPGGVAATQLSQQSFSAIVQDSVSMSGDNSQIYAALSVAPATSDAPRSISPAYEAQMRFNLDQAHLAYQQSRGTADAPAAAHTYIAQRAAYMQLRSDIKEGVIQIDRPQVMSTEAATQQPPSETFATTFSQYTPYGIESRPIEGVHLSETQYSTRHETERSNFRYTAARPLVVSPAYEEALKSRMGQAATLMDTAVGISSRQRAPMRLNPVVNNEVIAATSAYMGFQRAKQAGEVVVKGNATHHTPDFDLWSQRYHSFRPHATASAIPHGQTAQTSGPNPNRVSKRTVEEKSASLLDKPIHMKRASTVSRYAKGVGYRVEGWSHIAFSRASRKLYNMVQSGDDDASATIRTAEQGRYYAASAIALSRALAHRHSTDPDKVAKQATKREKRLYGQYHYMNQSELSTHISDNVAKGRTLKQEIKELQSKGAALTKEERLELRAKKRELAQVSRKSSRATAYRDLRQKDSQRVAAAKDLGGSKTILTNRKQIDETISKLRKAEETRIQKKFGDVWVKQGNGKKIPLTSVTDKSLNRSIQLMTDQGRELKQKIKLLQAKGSLLTAAERKQLLKLMKKHSALSADLRQYIGLRDARKHLQNLLDPYLAMRQRILKNAAGWSSGLYAMYHFMLRPIREGSEVGAMGLVKFADIVANRHVRYLVKSIVKYEYRTLAWIARKTRLQQAAKKAAKAVAKSVGRTASAQALKAGTASGKAAVRTAVSTTKAAMSRMTPQFVKTGVSSTMRAKALLSSAINRGKATIAKSAFGRATQAVYRAGSRVINAVKTVASAIKGFLIKGLLILLASIVIFGLVVSVIEVITVSISSIIMASDTEEDKLDLSPYFNIINGLDAEFNTRIDALRSKQDYDDVYISYSSGTMNNSKEMLSMMAVRMNQDLDLSTNPNIKVYLERLYNDSHRLSTKEVNRKCSGCETKTVTKTGTKIETGFEIDPTTGDVYEYEREVEYEYEEEVSYCPGHTDLYIEITVLGFDALFTENCGDNGPEGGTLSGTTAGDAGELIADDFIITHYCACDICCGPNASGLTSSGTTPKENRTIATDPSVIPAGATVKIEGYDAVFVAEDTGGAIDGHRIDIYMEDHHEALMAGEQYNVSVYWGDPLDEDIPTTTGDQTVLDTSYWDGWTEDNIAWCKTIYSQDWSELYAGAGVAGFATPVTDEELLAILDNLPADLSTERRAIIEAGLSGIGRISYNWGGKPTGGGLTGIPATGLDCSGFITWCYLTAGIPTQDWYNGGTGAINGSSSMVKISHSDLRPGDLGFKHEGGSASSSNANHVGIYIGKNANGKDVWLHCASGSGATINTYGGFGVYYRSTAFQ